MTIYIAALAHDTGFTVHRDKDGNNNGVFVSFSAPTPTTPQGTLYVSAPAMAQLIQQHGVQQCISDIAHNIREDFLRWQDFDKSARVANHSQDGVIELMPIADNKLYSFKYVNGHPKNTHQGLPTVMAFGVLADVDTGTPLLLSELTLTTALRTAAMSVVAAQVLARSESRIMALIGNGAQSDFQALAFQHVLGIEELRLYDVDAEATRKLMNNLRDTGLKLIPCKSIAEAVSGADIVTTVTADKTNAIILTPDMLSPGVHINAVGGDCPGKTELHADVLRRSQVFVEHTPQTRIEGDIQQMPADFAVTELWEVLAGRLPGRKNPAEITVFDSVGFALEDYSALRFVDALARRHGLGETLALIPDMSNPKNLLGVVRAQTPSLRRVA